MTEQSAPTIAVPEGRPGAGAALAASITEDRQRREKSKNVKTLGRLVPYVARHKADTAMALFFLVMATVSTLGLTAASRVVVDQGFAGGTPAALNGYFLMLVGVAVALAASSALRYFYVTKIGERVVADLRAALYRHILTLDPAFFMKTRTGEVLARLTTDITIVESLLATTASVALRNTLMLIGALIMTAVVSPRLTLYVLILAPVVILPMRFFGKSLRKRTVATQEQFAQAIAGAGESLDALDTIQAFGRETTAADQFETGVEQVFRTSLSRMKVRAVLTAVVISLVFGGITAVLWVGARSVVAGTMSGGELVQFVFLAVIAASSVGALGEVWGDVQKASGAMSRIAEILEAKPAISAPANPEPLPVPSRGEIAFEDVTFAYPGREETPALRGFTLAVKPGETVALVGPSGAGKSTVFRLILRFYDPQTGLVRVDGVDLTKADPKAVRERMALVAQDASLFSVSAAENIRFGRAEANDDEVRAAADAAEAEGFINALPEGFATPMGERAKTLSGGQRQRLAIARALVRNAPILLLDEATSALDAENERLVQAALARAMDGRTTLVIAHRLATILKADRIVVMDEGKVVEEGTHAQLTAKGGLYAHLAKLQFET